MVTDLRWNFYLYLDDLVVMDGYDGINNTAPEMWKLDGIIIKK